MSPTEAIKHAGLGEPRWAREHSATEKDGHTVHIYRPLYLDSTALRQLASLTFEGWAIKLRPTQTGLAIAITQGTD